MRIERVNVRTEFHPAGLNSPWQTPRLWQDQKHCRLCLHVGIVRNYSPSTMNDPLAIASLAAIAFALVLLVWLLVRIRRQRRQANRWVKWRLDGQTGQFVCRDLEDES